MTKFFNKFKTPYFCSIFDSFPPPIFWARKKKIFPENRALSRKTLFGFLITCQNLEKLMIQFEENVWIDGWTDGGRTDPISWNPSGYRQGSYQYD